MSNKLLLDTSHLSQLMRLTLGPLVMEQFLVFLIDALTAQIHVSKLNKDNPQM
jgi:hypothetical protein